jgi:hypothetical protein
MCPIDTLPIEGTQLNWVDELPAHLPGAVRFGPYLQARCGEALFEWPRVGRFRVREGRQIDIAIAPESTRLQAATLARSAPFGALVHQRGELPLHASTVVRPDNGRTLLLAGASGAGKSTTAAAFAQLGWKVLNDDLSRLTIDGSEALVWPGFPALKLWDRSCRLLRIDPSRLPAVYESKQKYVWSAGEGDGPRRVSAIIELHTEEQDDDLLERVSGSAAIRLLLRQTFRPRLVRALDIGEAHFARVSQVARMAPCFRFRNRHTLDPTSLAKYFEASLG